MDTNNNAGNMMLYAEIAVAVPIDHLYTYAIPEELRDMAAIGKRVLIPFGQKYFTGYIVGLSSSTTVEHVRDILDILDPEPVLTKNILRLTKWIADYYLCSWGVAIKAALPAGIDLVHAVTISLHPSYSDTPPDQLFPDETASSVKGHMQRKILSLLRQQGAMPLKDLQRKIGSKSLYSSLYALERQHIISIEHTDKAGKAKAKSLQHIALSQPPDVIRDYLADSEKRAPKHAAILQCLREHFPKEITVVELQHLIEFDPRPALKILERKGYVALSMKEVSRQPLAHFEYQQTDHLALTQEQQQAFDHIKAAIDAAAFAPMLLHGITGSGKTEVYIQAIAHTLSLNRRAIVLVPEISLTPLLVSRFLSRFGTNIAVLHSGLSTGERLDEWSRIRKGEVDVVIGARSAIFAPIDRLGIIVIDEEHEASYKQDTDPRYHGRDTAVMRARLEHVPIILGSATPSLESYYNAQTGKYHILSIANRIDQRPLPNVEIVDMREEKTVPQPIFSTPLEQAIREVLARREQVLLFLNLRGFANLYLCSDCGFVYECPRCSVTLTYHASSRRLQCHYCDFSRLPPATCPQCQSPHIQYRGIGTERVEQEMRDLFPEAAILRMDRDTVSGKHGHYKILRQFEQGEIDILIGTQMIAKGHDFPNVTLVGVIAAETALHLPDFRASERTFQILTQVAGRTGRGHLGGEVIIQTYTPAHYAILAAQNHDYLTFYSREIAYRQQLHYPPFSRVINILLQGSDEHFTMEIAQQTARFLRQTKHKGLTILGPTPAALTKLRNKYRFQILLKSPHSQYMRAFVKAQIDAFRKIAHLKDVQFIVDVDPVNLL